MSYILKRPLLTEKSVKLAEEGIYTFEVALQADKASVRKAVENLFGVKVLSVNTQIARGKTRITRRGQTIKPRVWKKAVVKLVPGQKIALLEGV